MSIEIRKNEHIDISINENVSNTHNYWDDIVLLCHRSLPEVNLTDVDISIYFLGKRISAPVMISAITGGTSRAKRINEALAKVAAECQIPMEVGSMRPAIDGNKSVRGSYGVLRDYDIPLRIANLGMPQFLDNGKRVFGEDEINDVMDLINADAIAIHLNFLQEIVQPEGDTNAVGGIEVICSLAKDYPIIVKETGGGLSAAVISALSAENIVAYDIGGVSGTTFSAVEYYRAKKRNDWMRERLGLTFWDWGIPSPLCVIDAHEYRICNTKSYEIIASGGLRSGLDAFKALMLGADIGAYARAFLLPASKGYKAALEVCRAIISEFRAAMFLSGYSNVKDLKRDVRPGIADLMRRGIIAFKDQLYDVYMSRQI